MRVKSAAGDKFQIWNICDIGNLKKNINNRGVQIGILVVLYSKNYNMKLLYKNYCICVPDSYIRVQSVTMTKQRL